MGALSFFRVARRVVGLSPLPEYHYLEALLEAEEGKSQFDFRLLATVVPLVVVALGAACFIPLGIHNVWMLFGLLGVGVLAGGLWFLFDKLDRSVPHSRVRLNRLANEIWRRYNEIGNLVGFDQTLSPTVAAMLDEAAGIYLRHSHTQGQRIGSLAEQDKRAHIALEEAMLRMLELAEPKSIREQELRISAGWASPLLSEMRQMDLVLAQRSQADRNEILLPADDLLIRLREARKELQVTDSAIEELKEGKN